MRLLLLPLLVACSAPPPIQTQPDASDPTPDATPEEDAGDPNTLVDSRDGKSYPLVHIGGQTWMGKNLAYEAPGTLCYDNNPTNCDTYGRLYPYSVALTACPDGFHLPSDDDWKVLETTLGMSAAALDIEGYSTSRGTNQGTQLKVGGGTGFDLLMAGYASGTLFDALADRTYLWTSTKVVDQVYRRRVGASFPYVYRFLNPIATFAISVRCLKD